MPRKSKQILPKLAGLALYLLILPALTQSAFAQRITAENTRPCEAGDMLLQVAGILQSPAIDRQAYDTLVRFGTDTRYYILMRGWIQQTLALTQEKLQRSNPEQRVVLQQKYRQLSRVLRHMDLE